MRTIDLFAGCGGLSLGFQRAGFDIVAAVDNWRAAIDVYQQNFSHAAFCLDIGSIETYDFLQQWSPDVVIGGPPCQDFSSAGKRTESVRADLTLVFAETVSQLSPQIFVMENVARIEKSLILRDAKAILKAAQYGLTEIVLDASLCGVPQARKRYFLIGVKDAPDDMMLPYLLKNLSTVPMTVRDYLGDSLGVNNYYRHPRSYARRGVFSIDEPSPTIRGVNRPIPKTYVFHEGDTCKDRQQIRPLTTLERSYLQTFPPDFIWNLSAKSDWEQMIGNAVPVQLAQYVGQAVQDFIQNVPLQIVQPAQLKLAI